MFISWFHSIVIDIRSIHSVFFSIDAGLIIIIIQQSLFCIIRKKVEKEEEEKPDHLYSVYIKCVVILFNVDKVKIQ